MKIVAPLIAISFLSLSSNAHASEPIQVLQMKGSATEIVGNTVYHLKVGSKLHANSHLKTAADSMLIMSLGKDVVTKLAADTRATVSIIRKKDWQLKLERGITASAIRNPEKRPNHFQVVNRGVVMGVRGTVFYTENLEHKPAFLCTCKGTVVVETEKGKQLDSITATHHDRPITLEEYGKELLVKTAPMGNGHSDADVTYLENLLTQLN